MGYSGDGKKGEWVVEHKGWLQTGDLCQRPRCGGGCFLNPSRLVFTSSFNSGIVWLPATLTTMLLLETYANFLVTSNFCCSIQRFPIIVSDATEEFETPLIIFYLID